MKIVMHTSGHTGAGKTSLAKSLNANLDLAFISESKIKHNLISSGYGVKNSLDESLRDSAYKLAILEAENNFRNSKILLIDAAFHKRARRDFIYSSEILRNSHIIVLFCYCDCIKKVENRIIKRKYEKKNNDNYADSMQVYNFISSNLETPELNEISSSLPSSIFHINTNTNSIDKVETNDKNNSLTKKNIFLIQSKVQSHLNTYKA